jgi:hypothetical protein
VELDVTVGDDTDELGAKLAIFCRAGSASLLTIASKLKRGDFKIRQKTFAPHCCYASDERKLIENDFTHHKG